MVRRIFLLSTLLAAFQSIAQISDNAESIELILEHIAQQNEDYDFTEVINELEYLKQNPLNLNAATKDELGQLLFLSDYQILSILNYRRRSGGFISIYELQYIQGFNAKFVALLKPYFFVGKKSTSRKVNWNRVLTDGNHSFILETGRVIQEQKGYLEKVFTDSVGNDSIINPSFEGDPYKVKIRYDFRFYNKVQAGVLLEKDPGEKIRPDRGAEVMDYKSVHIRYRGDKWLKHLVLGDYHAQAGQGLLYWTGYSNGKSLYFSSVQKRSMDFKGNTSFNETQFLRGAGVGLKFGKFQLNLFGSQNQRDASYLDSTQNSIKSFTLSGYHRTESELTKRRNITENVYGGSANITSNHAKFGINMLYTKYSKPLAEGEELYKSYNPNGSEFLGTSVDYRILYSRFQIYGETSYSNNALATLNSIAVNLYQNNSLLLLHRHYEKSYYSPLSNAFGINSNNRNEQGVFMGADINLGSKLNFLGYFDVFYFPWLKYGIKSASRGRDARAKLSYRASDHFTAFLQYSYSEKQKTISLSEDAVSASLTDLKLNKYRLNLQYDLTSSLSIRNQVEYAVYLEESDYADGWLINSAIKFRPECIPGFRSVLGLTHFYIPSYDARIYSYEYDVPGSFSFIGFSGKGSRISALVQYGITQKLDVYFKYAHSVFTDADGIGSSDSYIEGNTKSEFKFQMQIRF